MNKRLVPICLVICLLSAVLGACGQRRVAEMEVRRIGAEKLAQAADSLRPVEEQSSVKVNIPATAWPESLRLLQPEAGFVAHEGAYVRLETGLVSEWCLVVASPGITVPTDNEKDQKFEHREARIYLHNIRVNSQLRS